MLFLSSGIAELHDVFGRQIAFDINHGSLAFTRIVEEDKAVVAIAQGCKMTAKELAGKKLAVVPILRAGLGMVEGMLAMIPAAKVGHIGLFRDPETLEPVEYYCKLPADCEEREVFVVDPMLATGGSCIAAIQMLKNRDVKNIRFMCIIAAPEGVKKLQEAHPDVEVYIGALDEKLNEHGYIVPGLGDAGDRIFGTK